MNHYRETKKTPSAQSSSRYSSKSRSSDSSWQSTRNLYDKYYTKTEDPNIRRTCKTRVYIRPKTMREFPEKTPRTLYLRTSCYELRETTRTFALLIEITHFFINSTLTEILIPDLPSLLQKLITSFDTFSGHLVALFSTIRTKPISRNFSETSVLYQTGESFTDNWTEFIEYVNRTSEIGLNPYLNEFDICFKSLFAVMSFYENRMEKCNYISRAVLELFNKNRNKLIQIHSSLTELLQSSDENQIKKVDKKQYSEYLKTFNREMNYAMDRLLPNDVVSQIDISKIRTELSTRCSEINQIINSMCLFHECMSSLKTQIVELNTNLTYVYDQCGLPFALTLTVDDQIYQ